MRENTQTPVAARYHEGGILHLHSFFPTLQGEGPFCGERALFFRLAGCNLRCPGCDTDYTSTVVEVAPTFMRAKAEELGWRHGDLVVITGGEPLRQNIVPAVNELLDHGYRVQIESNGVLCPDGLPWDDEAFSLVCSPKTTRIHETILENARAFKYIIQAGQVDQEDGLPLRALLHKASPRVARPRPGALVYVQPMDEDDTAANALNLDAAIRSAMGHGHLLQIQVHKICNLE